MVGLRIITNLDLPLHERWEFDGQGRLLYWGQAEVDIYDAPIAETDEKWRIMKFIYPDGGWSASSKLWANNSKHFKFKWSERTTYFP